MISAYKSRDFSLLCQCAKFCLPSGAALPAYRPVNPVSHASLGSLTFGYFISSSCFSGFFSYALCVVRYIIVVHWIVLGIRAHRMLHAAAHNTRHA